MERLRMVDLPLITGLVTSPAWAAPLQNINALLTTLTLTAGLILGLARTWVELKRLFKDKDKGDDA